MKYTFANENSASLGVRISRALAAIPSNVPVKLELSVRVDEELRIHGTLEIVDSPDAADKERADAARWRWCESHIGEAVGLFKQADFAGFADGQELAAQVDKQIGKVV